MRKPFHIASKLLLSILLVAMATATSQGDIVLSTGTIDASSGTGVPSTPGGTATFSVTAAEIPEVELLADFFLIDAGVDIVVNGTSLFPQYEDLSNFGPVSVFTGTGEPSGGGINFPFSTNNSNLPRLTVHSTAAGTTYEGATFTTSTAVVPYTPVFTTQDFSSLLQPGSNTIEFFVLNNFQASNLDGEFTVTLKTAAVPEPSAGFAFVLGLSCVVARRRRDC